MAFLSYTSMKINLLLTITILCWARSFTERCVDTDNRCLRWSMEGECEKSAQMRRECPKSCRVCIPDFEQDLMDDISASTKRSIIVYIAFLSFFVIAFFVACIRVKSAGGVCRSKGNMRDKLVIITGATSGLGLEMAFHLALRGARVIIGCRNLKKGFKAAKDLRQQTGQKLIEARKLDLASLDSVREFANEICEEFPKIDVLINNAGMISGSVRLMTVDNYESTFQVNYLGHFLLTKLLIKPLKENAPSRIINVVSDDFKYGNINFSDLQTATNFSNITAYRNANTAIMYFTKELSNVLKGCGVTVNVVNPGRSVTDLWRHVFPYNLKLTWLLIAPYTYLFWKSASLGAETAYYCALDHDLEKISGKYFKDCVEVEYPELQDEIGRKLWAVSERLIQPKKLSTLNQAAIKKALNSMAEKESHTKRE